MWTPIAIWSFIWKVAGPHATDCGGTNTFKGVTIEPITKPLLEWVLQRHPETPKTRAKDWIVAGRIRVGGVVVRKPHEKLPDPGDTLQLLGRHGHSLSCGSGWKIHPRVTLVFLDSALAVVNKGPGLISVPGAVHPKLSALSILADFLSGKLKASDPALARKPLPSAYQDARPLPVHRLDQYTSGAFCLALNPVARQHLIDQVRAGTMERTYIAFVEGRASSPRGTWRNWLELDENELRQRVIAKPPPGAPSSRVGEAITHYEVLAEYPVAGGQGYVTKLRLKLQTGLKHQIRVQAAHAKLPLIGDRTHHPASRQGGSGALVPFDRQALHAESLSLEHPERPGERMKWTVPLPSDLQQLQSTLRAGRGRAGEPVQPAAASMSRRSRRTR